MRYIGIFLFLLTFSFSEDFLSKYTNDNYTNQSNNNQTGFFERFYLYGSFYNHQSVRNKDKNIKENSAGINLVKTLELPFGDKNNLHIDGKAIFDNYEQGSEEVFTFNELYVIAKINDIEFEIGRRYSDFSVAKTYTLLDFISKPLSIMDSEDNEISKQGRDGVSFGYTPSWLQNAEMFFYGYTDELTDSENTSEGLLVELRLNNQFVRSRAYSFLNNKEEISLAGSIIANVNPDTDVYGEINYKDQKDIDYILGIKYQAYKNVSVILERAVLNSGSSFNETAQNLDFNETKLMDHYKDSELLGNHYINGFIQYKFPDYPSSIYLSAIRNIIDESNRISFKLDYIQGRIKYSGQITRNIGAENTELYYQENTKITFHISLNLADRNTDTLATDSNINNTY